MSFTTPPSNPLAQLGLKGQAPYLPGYPQAPLPTKPTLRKEPMLAFHQVAPLSRANVEPAQLLRGGAVIGGLVAALNQLDHFARQAEALGFLRHATKYLVKQLVQLSDKMVGEYAKDYAVPVADMANQQGSLLGQSAELFMQLTARQQQASLTHMHQMAELNLVYEPTPAAPRGPLPNPNHWRRVVVETPYAGDVAENLRYLRACLRDCLLHGDAPIASHGLFCQPGVLDDDNPDERELGIDAGLTWAELADATVVYTDRGISTGVQAAIVRAENEGRQIIYRTLPDWTPATGLRPGPAADDQPQGKVGGK